MTYTQLRLYAKLHVSEGCIWNICHSPTLQNTTYILKFSNNSGFMNTIFFIISKLIKHYVKTVDKQPTKQINNASRESNDKSVFRVSS